MAALHAKKNKWNDAFLLNSRQTICDSSIANIFIIKNEEVFTPALSQGCVAGIMREYFINALKTSAWKVNETTVSMDDVLEADEVFLTNSIYNMRWVKSIGDVLYTNLIVQKIYTAVVPTIGKV